jgi:hypothetical protein
MLVDMSPCEGPDAFARAGIKKPKSERYLSTKGVDPKFLRNKRYALRGMKRAAALAHKHKKAESA